MNKSSWEAVLEYYKLHFGIGEDLVELVADYDIILLAATGATNAMISEILDIDAEMIQEVLRSLCDGFAGWDTPLPYNPYLIYADCLSEAEHKDSSVEDPDQEFVGKLFVEFGIPTFLANTMLNVVKKCYSIEAAVNSRWV